MDETKQLLKDAAEEIRRLRRQNELMAAKIQGVEMMAAAVTSEKGYDSGTPMMPCLASKIDAHLNQEGKG